MYANASLALSHLADSGDVGLLRRMLADTNIWWYRAGRHGEAPSLRSLDDDGNLVATIGMDAYYATLAESWFGVPAADVLPGSVAPLEGIVRAA